MSAPIDHVTSSHKIAENTLPQGTFLEGRILKLRLCVLHIPSVPYLETLIQQWGTLGGIVYENMPFIWL